MVKMEEKEMVRIINDPISHKYDAFNYEVIFTGARGGGSTSRSLFAMKQLIKSLPEKNGKNGGKKE